MRITDLILRYTFRGSNCVIFTFISLLNSDQLKENDLVLESSKQEVVNSGSRLLSDGRCILYRTSVA